MGQIILNDYYILPVQLHNLITLWEQLYEFI